jgi:hypothetical protein
MGLFTKIELARFAIQKVYLQNSGAQKSGFKTAVCKTVANHRFPHNASNQNHIDL